MLIRTQGVTHGLGKSNLLLTNMSEEHETLTGVTLSYYCPTPSPIPPTTRCCSFFYLNLYRNFYLLWNTDHPIYTLCIFKLFERIRLYIFMKY